MKDATIKLFGSIYNITSTINKLTCYKNSDTNYCCIDLILTNFCQLLWSFSAIESKFPDFHKMFITIKETYYHQIRPKTINYPDYKVVCNEIIWEPLQVNLNRTLLDNYNE